MAEVQDVWRRLGTATRVMNTEIKKEIIRQKAVDTGRMRNVTKIVKLKWNENEDDFTISEDTEDHEYQENKEQGIEFNVSRIESSRPYKNLGSSNKDESKTSKDQTTSNDEGQQSVKRFDLGEYLTDDGDHKEDSSDIQKQGPQENNADEAYVKKTIEQNTDDTAGVKNDRIDPMNSSVDEMKKHTEQRKAKMKRYNHRFNNKQSLEELEKQPAFKRAGVELDQNRSSNRETNISRTSFQDDQEKGIQFRKNNSYLHDNAD